MILLALLLAGTSGLSSAPIHDGDEDALREISRQIELRGGDAELYLVRSNLFRQRGLLEFALCDLDHALGLGAAPRRVALGRASVLHVQGRETEAILQLDALLVEDPTDAAALVIRAGWRAARGEVDASIADYSRALELHPEPAGFLALARLLVGRPGGEGASQALECLESGIRALGPVPALTGAALDIEIAAGDYGRALERIDRMLQTADRKEQLLFERGKVLSAAGRLDEAVVAQLDALSAIGRLGPRHRQTARILELTEAVRIEIRSLSNELRRGSELSDAEPGKEQRR